MPAGTLVRAWVIMLIGAAAPGASAQNAATAAATRPTAERPRVRISVNAGAETGSIDLASSISTPLYLEAETVSATYGVGHGPMFDGGVLYRLTGGLHVGLTVSSLSTRQDSLLTATIPHPFFYNRPRSVTGTAAGLERHELTTHLQAAWVITAARRVDIAIAAGPSWFHVTQDLVSGISVTETYPYDTAALASTQATRASNSHIGVNAAVDVGVRIAKNVGLGGVVRYSHASVELPLAGSASAVTSDAGGTLAGGGLRLFF
jgi:hypothetical protein